ncbi:hypothetical protein MTR67_036153 [Solanum verrucosum]|uniref:Uncharacterized protein n=1 Tax=Solanum verrucosum TaxID=315347 RepID=A0AAF0ZM63_SOLVR|nr:hypothetical protein MTR67_036153 [Solanum verrucosum]
MFSKKCGGVRVLKYLILYKEAASRTLPGELIFDYDTFQLKKCNYCTLVNFQYLSKVL